MIDLRDLGTITSGYGLRDSPTAGASTVHKGLDIVLKDSNIPSVSSGTVSYVGYSKSGGNTIAIKQSDGVTARYMHLASPSTLKVGDTVTEGQTIGIQGSTGISTGDHVHIQFEDNKGSTLDPVAYFETGDGTNTNWYLESDSGGILSTIATKVIQILAVIIVMVLAAYLFLKAFDIKII